MSGICINNGRNMVVNHSKFVSLLQLSIVSYRAKTFHFIYNITIVVSLLIKFINLS